MSNYPGFGISPDTAASPSHTSTPQRRDSLNSDPRMVGGLQQMYRSPHYLLNNGITSPGPGQGTNLVMQDFGKILTFRRKNFVRKCGQKFGLTYQNVTFFRSRNSTSIWRCVGSLPG